jgi:acyl-CoA synthetase (AMP-forming)/AMP-acid ligase II
MIPHGGLIKCSLVQGGVWVAEPLRILNNLPINHIGCVGDISCFALVAGGTIVFMESFDPGAIPGAIARERITCWGQVPAMFAMALGGGAERQRAGADYSSLQLIVWSGSAAPRDLIRRSRHPRRHHRLAVARLRVPDRAPRRVRGGDR